MKNLIKALAFSFALLISAPLFAQQTYQITIAPPALQTEVIPDQPFANAVWQPGYFNYDPVLQNYSWVSGQWVTPPFAGATYISPTYELTSDGTYLFVHGKWVGDNGTTIMTAPRNDDTKQDLREREKRNMEKIKVHEEE